MSSKNYNFFLCINLLFLVTGLCLGNDKLKHAEVLEKRTATNLNKHSEPIFNNYYTTGGNLNGYGSKDQTYFNGYETGSGVKFDIHGLRNGEHSDKYKTRSNGLGNNVYYSGSRSRSSELDGKTSFAAHARRNTKLSENGLNYIYHNGNNVLNSRQNYGFRNIYSLENIPDSKKINRIYDNKFRTYTSDDSVENIENLHLQYNPKTYTHSHHTITKEVVVPQPYPVIVTKHVSLPVPQPHRVKILKPISVPVQVKVPVQTQKPYSVTLKEQVPYFHSIRDGGSVGHDISNVRNHIRGIQRVSNFDRNIDTIKRPISRIGHINTHSISKVENVDKVTHGVSGVSFGSVSEIGHGHRICDSEDKISTGGYGSSRHHIFSNIPSNIKPGQAQTFSGTSGTYSGVYVPSSQGGLHGTGYNTYSKNWNW